MKNKNEDYYIFDYIKIWKKLSARQMSAWGMTFYL